MEWKEHNLTNFSIDFIKNNLLNTSHQLSTGEVLKFFAVKVSGTASVSEKTSKFPVIDLKITADFKLTGPVQNNKAFVSLTGQFIVKDFTGKDDMAIKILFDTDKVPDGAIAGNIKPVLERYEEKVKKEGKEWLMEFLNEKYINALLANNSK
jgi:hypothetical protein